MYCTVDDIQHLANSDYFARLKVPNDAELRGIAEVISGEIDGYLHQHGYELPVKDEVLLRYCASLNAYGVAGAIERKPDELQERKGLFQLKYEKGLAMLVNRRWVGYSTNSNITTGVEEEW